MGRETTYPKRAYWLYLNRGGEGQMDYSPLSSLCFPFVACVSTRVLLHLNSKRYMIQIQAATVPCWRAQRVPLYLWYRN